ncbi:MAG: hydantoinase B/oxoprolinase family protein, partial [Myxococcales bacterium]|nr:hydantoinase B/oxoprolinase family protein [Myxococcales bacterium]
GGVEPTVTDAHAVLGRVEHLLGGHFTLDRPAAEAAVAGLAEALGASLEATAQAILDVAQAAMARACKRVSLDRGVDPRTLTLVAFGGAGGLHACALADELGCPEVLFPAEPGVLSAAGIVDAPREAAATRSLFALEGPAWAHLGGAWAELCRAVEAELAAPERVHGFVDCRYTGQTHPLAVPVPGGWSGDGLRAAFDALHAARYGYAFGPERPVEVVTLRAFAEQPPPAVPAPAPVPAQAVTGPATVGAWSATLWLPAGWSAARLPSGDWLCRRTQAATGARQGPLALALEVHRQRMAAIAEEMGATLMRAAFSANIKERQDYSCAVFDGQGQMVVHAAHIPVHLGSTPLSVQAAIAAGPMPPGSEVILNDPFEGGTHLPDVTLVRPVYLADTDPAPAFYVANRAHHADVGGISPGSLPSPRRPDGTTRALTIDDEGLCLPPSRLDEALRDRFAAASRTPDERRGDLRAQEAANRVGAERLRAWAAQQGLAAVAGLNAALLNYAERRIRAALTALPDGQWHALDHLDDDGLSDTPVPLPVTVRIQGDTAEFDFTGAPDAVAGPMNAVRAIAVSAVFYAVRCLVGAELPANAGLMRPIRVLTRPGSVVDARPPAAVSAGNVETSQRLVDVLMQGFGAVAPGRLPACSQGTMNNVLIGSVPGASSPWVYYETLAGGYGGGPSRAGATATHSHMTNTLNTPIEALEHAFPMRIVRYEVRRGSGGAGVHPGGDGLVRAYELLAPAEVTVIAERRGRGAPGADGGGAGAPGVQSVREGGVASALPGKVSRVFEAGSVIEIGTPGGGGWGRR